jgi:hypothetical protein
MTLDLKPEIAGHLIALPNSRGLSVEDYLREFVERELQAQTLPGQPAESGTGMVEQNGLLVYRTGNPLPVHLVDDAIRRSRDERSWRLLGSFS